MNRRELMAENTVEKQIDASVRVTKDFSDTSISSITATDCSSFTAIVLAGSRCLYDPVASVFGERYKALVPIYGQPMISRVVEALSNSDYVSRIVIVFDCTDSLYDSCPEFQDTENGVEISVVSCANSISSSILKAMEASDKHWPYLVTTADHALLTSDIVNEFCESALQSSDIAVGLVEKTCLDEAHPGSKRTYLPFRETKLSGANLFAFLSEQSWSAIEFWGSIESLRKTPWRLFSAFGWRNLAGLLFKRYTVDQAFERVSVTLGAETKAVRLSIAEAAIDVDSQKDYHQATRILELRDELPEEVMPAAIQA